jgi:predicted transcriptional regulator
MRREKARLTLELPALLNARLEEMAQASGVSKSEVIKKALALFDVAHDASREGKNIAIVKKGAGGERTIESLILNVQ